MQWKYCAAVSYIPGRDIREERYGKPWRVLRSGESRTRAKSFVDTRPTHVSHTRFLRGDVAKKKRKRERERRKEETSSDVLAVSKLNGYSCTAHISRVYEGS